MTEKVAQNSMRCPTLLIGRPKEGERGFLRGDILLGPWAQWFNDPTEIVSSPMDPYPDPSVLHDVCENSFVVAQGLLRHLNAVLPKVFCIEDQWSDRYGEFFFLFFLTHITNAVEDMRQRCRCLVGQMLRYGEPLSGPVNPPVDLSHYIEEILSSTALRLAMMGICAKNVLTFSETIPTEYHVQSSPHSQTKGKTLGWRPFGRKAILNFLSINFSLKNPLGVLWNPYHLGWREIGWLARNGFPYSRFSRRMNNVSEKKLTIDWDLRRRAFSGCPPPYNEILPLVTPQWMMEGFLLLFQSASQAGNRLYPSQPPGYILSVGLTWSFDEFERAVVSSLAARGSKFISIQHGGGYGIFETMSKMKLEQVLCDRFYSWGWNESPQVEDEEKKITPLPSFYLGHLAMLKPQKKKWQCLVLTHINEMFPRWLYNPIFPDMASDYFQRQKVLLDGLKTQSPIAVKVYPLDYGWGYLNWIKSRYSEFTIIEQGKFTSLAGQSALVVIDNNSTALLECLAMGRPFVATWNRRWFKSSPLFENLLDELLKCGVFYESPEALVSALPGILENLERWAQIPGRKEALSRLTRAYAWHQSGSFDLWQNEFKTLAAAIEPKEMFNATNRN